jgi:hypothetical protein
LIFKGEYLNGKKWNGKGYKIEYENNRQNKLKVYYYDGILKYEINYFFMILKFFIYFGFFYVIYKKYFFN